MAKRKIIYGETYKAGTVADDHAQVIEKISRPGSIVFIKRHDGYDDDTQELTVTIRFKSKK